MKKACEEINFYTRDGEYGWLSNFYRAKQVVGVLVYPTNEHYYQSQKARDKFVHDWIGSAPTPFLAMQAGRSLRRGKELVDNWDDMKVDVMLKGLRAKFQNSELKAKLLATGDATIHEDSPTDSFWGIRGKDMLGKLLMRVRSELRGEAGLLPQR